MMALFIWFAALPAWVKRLAAAAAFFVAVILGLWLLYGAGEHRGRAQEREHVTDSLQAVLIGRLAHQRESLKVDTRHAVDSAAQVSAALEQSIEAFRAARGRSTVNPEPVIALRQEGSALDTLAVQYADGRTRALPVLPAVDTIVHDLLASIQRKDSLLAIADTILSLRVPAARRADSVAIARLARSTIADDTLITALEQQNATLARRVADLTPSGFDRIARLATWAAIGYGAVQLARAVHR